MTGPPATSPRRLRPTRSNTGSLPYRAGFLLAQETGSSAGQGVYPGRNIDDAAFLGVPVGHGFPGLNALVDSNGASVVFLRLRARLPP